MRFSLFEEPDFTFCADPSVVRHLKPALDEILFNKPYHKGFESRSEGYISLGAIPNPEDFEQYLENDKEEYVLKNAGDTQFSVPADCKPLIPAIELAAAFELANGSEELLKGKSCNLVVRDHLFYEDTPAQELHRDPPNIDLGRSQNTYSFSTSLGTVFPGFKTPEPFEMVCFTSASPHHRPSVMVPNRTIPFRRVFVAIAFNCYLKTDNLDAPPNLKTNGRHYN